MPAERRHRLREELSLILPALFIAVVVWAIAKQQKLETNWLNDIRVTLGNIPANMDVKQVPTDVRIQVRYPAELHNSAIARNFGFTIDAARVFRTDADQAQPQKITYQLAPRDIDRHNVPDSIQVVEVQPPKILLTATLRTSTATVEVISTGQLPRNLELTDKLQARPPEVLVTGAVDALQKLGEHNYRIKTAPIDLSQLQASCEVYPKLVLPDGIQLVGRANQVTVAVGLTERTVRRTYKAVPVMVPVFSDTVQARLRPQTVEVEVEGPDTDLRQLSNQDFDVYPPRNPAEVVNKVQRVGIEAHLKNPGTSPVRVVRCIPNTIDVEFIPKGAATPTPAPTPKPATRPQETPK